MNGGAVSQMSSKQDAVADSTIEAEYIAACEAAKEGVWIQNFLDNLGIFPASIKLLDLLVIILVPSHKPRSQGITTRPDI